VSSSSPYFTYTSPSGASHVVWYENTQSIPLKSQLAVTYNLMGVSVFALGYDDQTFWEALSTGLGTDPH
jgi:spore germination protein